VISTNRANNGTVLAERHFEIFQGAAIGLRGWVVNGGKWHELPIDN
jgi:hypothetical protein